MTTPAVILGPMFHLSGIMPILRALSLGTTIHIMGKWNADVAFDMIEKRRHDAAVLRAGHAVRHVPQPRATPELLARSATWSMVRRRSTSNWSKQIMARMPNCQLANTYGQTEATAWSCSISGDIYLDHPAACGYARRPRDPASPRRRY